MSEEKGEKRESKRTFFTRGERVDAAIQTHGEPPFSLNINILSISSGGMGLFGPTNKLSFIKAGDRLTITDIKTPQPLGPIASLEVEVKYIMNVEDDARTVFGCLFTRISDALRNKIQNFVEYRLSTAPP